MSNVVVLGTSDSIVAVLAAAPTTTQPAFSSSWVDTTASTTSSNKGTLNGTSEVTIVAAPGSNQRQVDFMRIYNSDTALATLTVSIANGANRYPIGKWVLAIGYFIDVLVTPSGSLSNNDSFLQAGGPSGVSGFLGSGNSQSIATAGNSTFTLSNSANSNGILLISHAQTGQSALVYFCYPNALVIVSSSGGYFSISSAPSSGFGLSYLSSTNALTVYNETGATATIRCTVLGLV